MRASLLAQLNTERAGRRGCVLVTDLKSGDHRLVREGEIHDDALAEALARAFRSGKSGLIEGREIFLNVHLPPPRLLAIGAVHISQALAPMAKLAGFDMEVLDPRTAFASPERFPSVLLHADWPEIVLRDTPLDPYTAVVAVSHDPKIDDLPLMEALRIGCFYVGALGSRKTHARRVERLLSAGVPRHEIDRIEAPIGLDIGAATPAEIAVAILASVVSAFRKRKVHAERLGEAEPS